MADGRVHDRPSDVEAEAGEVMVSGPDGVAVSMTPDAAVETGYRLIDGGAEAQGKKMPDRGRHEKPGDGDIPPAA